MQQPCFNVLFYKYQSWWKVTYLALLTGRYHLRSAWYCLVPPSGFTILQGIYTDFEPKQGTEERHSRSGRKPAGSTEEATYWYLVRRRPTAAREST